MASIVTANVLTLFNAIIGVFFILILSLGLWADALFGLIAIVNSAIGIRQELKAKETLDQLALLVAPRAKAIRDGRVVELTADEVVPGDVVRVEPGDQLVADGQLVDTRGLTVDESLLTGESDGIRKRVGDRMLSGAFGLSGSGHYEVDAVREDSYAEKIAGEAREFRHAPSPLQLEVNEVLRATTIALVPIALIVLVGFTLHDKEFRDAAQEATAGPGDADPRGPGAADERHPRGRRGAAGAPEHARPADGGDRGAGRGRHDLRRQDRHAHRRHAEAGRGRGRRPRRARGRRARARPPSPPRPGERNRTLETIAERYPAHPEQPTRRGAVLVAVEVERADPERLQLRDRRARRARARRRPDAARGPRSARSTSTPAPAGG